MAATEWGILVHYIKEANYSYLRGKIRHFFDRSFTDEDLQFRRYFGYCPGNACTFHIKTVLETMANSFVSAFENYSDRSAGYSSADRSILKITLRHESCHREIEGLSRIAVKRYMELIDAAHVASRFNAHKNSSEHIPADILSPALFPSPRLRGKLAMASEAIGIIKTPENEEEYLAYAGV
jgi:hypothetical protein